MIEKQIKREWHDTVYEATDGTTFNSKEECEKYEQTAHAVVRTKFLKLVVKKGTEYSFFNVGTDDSGIYAIKINSQEDVNTVLQLYYLDNPCVLREEEQYKKYKDRAFNLTNTAYQEQDILFVGENYDGDIYLINTKANIIEGLKKVGLPKEEKE